MIRAILAALLLTGCASLPDPSDCVFYGVHDDGGMRCSTVTEVPMTRREMDRAWGEDVWGKTEIEGGHCTIYHVGEYARRHEWAHVHCGRFHAVSPAFPVP